MYEVSLLRLYLLRAMYLLVAVGFCFFMWPSFLFHAQPWSLKQGIVACMLIAFWVLCVLGVRYPLRMLPILLWELIWKTVWLAAVALPQWRSGTIDEATMATASECIWVVIIPFVLPWGYMVRHYLKEPGDPWRRPGASAQSNGSRISA